MLFRSKVKEGLLLNKHVFWTPWVTESELADKMRDADMFIFPSYAEGGARVVTEAMAMGLPVITTWNSGTPITHGYDGIISELDALMIFNFVVELFNDPQRMWEIGRNAHQTIRQSISDEEYISKFDIDFSLFK